ncbi:MAG: hypothetical protein COB54_08415 [Alphaproteobacteria bacterium]|nr:MAG: hypothetical protein COB54_08415 [Alphaproteobacteria bacterium]
MTVPLPLDNKDSARGIAPEDLKDIRQFTLANISEEVLQISDLVENSIVDLSDEFMKLVKYSKQQVDDMTMACDLLQAEKDDKDGSNNDKIHEMLRESAEVSTYFHQNVNRMIYTMQFQDRARQLMQAISVSLNILIYLSETIENNQNSDNIKETVTISEDNKNILTKLIEDAAHRELDQNYILRMFMGGTNTDDEPKHDDSEGFTDIEFF